MLLWDTIPYNIKSIIDSWIDGTGFDFSPFCLLILKNEQDYHTVGKFYDISLQDKLKILQVEFNCTQHSQNITRKSHNFSDAFDN